jgi:hypothetical protein
MFATFATLSGFFRAFSVSTLSTYAILEIVVGVESGI